MQRALAYIFVLVSHLSFIAQTFQSENIKLLSRISPEDSIYTFTDPLTWKYNGCWGWFQESKGKEYGIIGSQRHVYFIDVTNPEKPIICDSTSTGGQEIKTYKNFCYSVTYSSMQIIDMQYLPDSVHIVYSGAYGTGAHTLWIDKNKLYFASGSTPNIYNSLGVFDLSDPANPVFLRSLKTDMPFIKAVHDMYVNNDTIFASCTGMGLYIIKYDSALNKFSQLGSLDDYHPTANYNHSSYLTQDKKHLMMLDEIPTGIPIHMVDVSDVSNPQITCTAIPHPKTTPHNAFITENRWGFVSCYEDGLVIYDLKDRTNIKLAGYFDTYPQSGANTGTTTGAYNGNWGAYPFFPSKNILALDMQNGMFMLDASDLIDPSEEIIPDPVGEFFVDIYPNPNNGIFTIKSNSDEKTEVTIKNNLGQAIADLSFNTLITEEIDLSQFASGVYYLSCSRSIEVIHKRVVLVK